MRQDVTTVTAECAGVEFTVKGSVETNRMACRLARKKNYHPRLAEGDADTEVARPLPKERPNPSRCMPKPPCSRQWKRRAKSRTTTAAGDEGLASGSTTRLHHRNAFQARLHGTLQKVACSHRKRTALNSVVKTMRIADVAMTGEWEKELARIERGNCPTTPSAKEIEAYT